LGGILQLDYTTAVKVAHHPGSDASSIYDQEDQVAAIATATATEDALVLNADFLFTVRQRKRHDLLLSSFFDTFHLSSRPRTQEAGAAGSTSPFGLEWQSNGLANKGDSRRWLRPVK
jgi:hypothetical protein